MDADGEMDQFMVWLHHCHPERARQIVDSLTAAEPDPVQEKDPEKTPER
jgi:(2Fe-2S) ferredoxin